MSEQPARHGSRRRWSQFAAYPRRPGASTGIIRRPTLTEAVGSQVSADSAGRYTCAVGLLVARQDSFDEERTLKAIEAGVAEITVELPRDLPRIAEWPRQRSDTDRFQHRVALLTTGGRYELLQHFCVDNGRSHEPPGHHSWGDSGHEADDLAYSLLCVRYGERFTPGWRIPYPSLSAMLFPGLFDVIARLGRGLGWRMQWDQLADIATERNDR